MPILCVKVGQNEPDQYEKIKRLDRHLDIVEIPADETLTSYGRMGDKEFLVIRFNWGNVKEEDRKRIRGELTRRWAYLNTDTTKNPLSKEAMYSLDQLDYAKRQWSTEALRLYYLDHDALPYKTTEQKATVALAGLAKERVKNFDMKAFGANDNRRVSFSTDLAPYIINKFSGKTLAQELGL